MCSELSSNKYGRLFRPTTRYREHIDSGVVVTVSFNGDTHSWKEGSTGSPS